MTIDEIFLDDGNLSCCPQTALLIAIDNINTVCEIGTVYIDRKVVWSKRWLMVVCRDVSDNLANNEEHRSRLLFHNVYILTGPCCTAVFLLNVYLNTGRFFFGLFFLGREGRFDLMNESDQVCNLLKMI